MLFLLNGDVYSKAKWVRLPLPGSADPGPIINPGDVSFMPPPPSKTKAKSPPPKKTTSSAKKPPPKKTG